MPSSIKGRRRKGRSLSTLFFFLISFFLALIFLTSPPLSSLSQTTLYVSSSKYLNNGPTSFSSATVSSRTLNSIITSLLHRRILIAVVAYDFNQLGPLERIFDSMRDICEAGASVDMVIYTAMVWPDSVLDRLDAKSRMCRHEHGSFQVSIRIKSPDYGVFVVDFHRQFFYENIDKYDLFVYTEDDHVVRPHHILAYLQETEHLRNMLGEDRYTDYSIGFLRYELNESNEPVVFEFKWDLSSRESFQETHMVHIPEIGSANNTLHTYFNSADSYHQGMYMATPDQLRKWRHRPNCHFNDTSFYPHERRGHRELVSSLYLFSRAGCNVTQLIPTASYHDFLIHHASQKYTAKGSRFYPKFCAKFCTNVELLASFLPTTTSENPYDSNQGGLTMFYDNESATNIEKEKHKPKYMFWTRDK